jgi:hypothetical protein
MAAAARAVRVRRLVMVVLHPVGDCVDATVAEPGFPAQAPKV